MSDVLHSPPGGPADFQRLENAYASHGDWKNLAALYRGSASVFPDPKQGVLSILKAGNVYRDRLGDRAKAESCYAEGVSVYRGWIEAEKNPILKSDLLCELAKLYQEVVRDREKAIEAYVEAFELDTSKTHIMAVLGDLYAQKEDWAQVLDRFRAEARAASDPGQRLKCLEEMAEIYAMVLSDTEAAAGLYREILSLDPRHAKAESALENLLIRSRRWSELITAYEARREACQTPDETVTVLTKLALIYKDKLRQPLRAAGIYQDILRIQPGNFRISAKLEELRGEPQRWEEALEALEKEKGNTSDKDRRLGILMDQAAVAQTFLGQAETAARFAGEALGIRPDHPQALSRAVSLWSSQGAWDLVADAYSRAADAASTPSARAAALRELAEVCRVRLCEPARAIAALEAIRANDPDDAAAGSKLAALYEEQRLWGPLEGILVSAAARALEEDRIPITKRLAALREDQLGAPDRAIESYETLVSLDPHHPAALEALERLYTQGRRWQELEGIYARRSQQATAPEERGRLFLARARILEEKLGRLGDAAAAYEQALALSGDRSVTARVEQIYFTEKKWDKLVDLYRRTQARTIDPQERNRLDFKSAEILEQKLDRPERARACLNAILERDPAHVGALRKLETIAEREEAWESLIDIYRREFEAETDPSEKVNVYLRAADVFLRRLGDEKKAEGCYRRVLGLDAGNAVALEFLSGFYRSQNRHFDLYQVLRLASDAETDPKPLAALHFETGRLLRDHLGKGSEALNDFERAVDLDPSHSEARSALSALYEDRSQWEALVKSREAELEHCSDRLSGADLSSNIGRLYRDRLKNLPQAAVFLRRSLDLNPLNVGVLKDLTAALDELRRHDEALPFYERLLQLAESDDERAGICRRLAELAMGVHADVKRAAEWYERELKYDPSSRTALERLPQLYESQEDWEGLLGTFERILPFLEGAVAAEMHLRIGRIHEERLGAVDKALIAYQIAHEADPSAVAPLRALRRLLRDEANFGEYLKVTIRQAELTPDKAEKAALLREAGALWRDKFSQPDKAIGCLEQALSLDPKDLVSLEALCALYFERKMLDAALETGERALAALSEPLRRIPLLERLGDIEFHHRRNPKEAALRMREILSIDPAHKGALGKLAEIARASEDWKGLLSVLQLRLEAENTREAKVKLLFSIAELWRGPLNSLDNALETLRVILAIDPANFPAFELVGEICRDPKRWAATLNPAFVEMEQRGDVEGLAKTALCAARVFEERFREVKAAVAAIERVLPATDDRPDLLEALMHLHRRDGNKAALAEAAERRARLPAAPAERVRALREVAELWAEDLGDVARAVEALEEARRADPQSRDVADALIRLNLRRGDWQAASDMMRDETGREIAGSLRWRELSVGRAGLLAEKLGAPGDALEILEAVLREAPDHRPALEAASALYEGQDLPEPLANTLRLLAESAPGGEAVNLRLRLADLYRDKLGRTEEAVYEFERIVRMAPRHREALLRLEAIHEERDDTAALAAVLAQQIPLTSDSKDAARIYHRLARLHEERLGEPGRAIEYFQRALERDPDLTDVADRLIRHFREARRHLDLAEVLRVRAERAPSEQAVPLYSELAEIWLTELGNPIASLEFFERVLSLDQGNLKSLRRIDEIHRRNENHRAREQVLRRLAEAAETEDERIETFLTLGEIQAENLNSHHEAIATYRHVLTIDPRNASAMDRLRGLFSKEERWADLADILRRIAAEVKPESSLPLLRELASLELEKLRQPGAALKTLSGIREIFPKDLEVSDRLAELYEQQGRFGDLAEILEERLAAQPSPQVEERLLLRLGTLYDIKLSKPAEATKCLEQVLGRDMRNVEVLTRLEGLYRRQGRFTEASRILEERGAALPIGPERSRILRSLADRFWIERRADDAVRCYRLLAADPSERRSALERVAAIEEAEGRSGPLSITIEELVRTLDDPAERAPRLLQWGKLLAEQPGRAGRAEKIFLSGLAAAPHDASFVDALRSLYRRESQWQKAVTLLEEELAAQRKDVRRRISILRELAEIWRGPLGDIERAARYYEELVTLSPHEMDAVAVLAKLHFEKGAFDRAAPLYERLVKVVTTRTAPSDSARIFYELGTVMRHLGRSDEAILNLNQSLTYDSSSADSVHALSDLYFELGQWDNALKMLQRVTAPGSAGDRSFVSRHYYRLLQTLERLEQYDKARQLFLSAKEHLDDHLGALKIVGGLFLKAQQWDEARAAFNRVLVISDGVADRHAALYPLADLAFHRFSDPGAAREHLVSILRDDPAHIPALELFLEINEAEREWPEVLRTLEELARIEKDPEKLSWIHYRLGRICDQETGDLRRARDAYLKAIEVGKGDTPASDALGALCSTAEDWRELIEGFERAATGLRKDNQPRKAANFHLAAGCLLEKHLGEKVRAEQSFRRALSLDTECGGALRHLASLLGGTGSKRDEALTLQEKALSMSPTDVELLREAADLALGCGLKSRAFIARSVLAGLGVATADERNFLARFDRRGLFGSKREVTGERLRELLPEAMRSGLSLVFRTYGEALVPVYSSNDPSTAMLSATDVVPKKTIDTIHDFACRLGLPERRIPAYYSTTVTYVDIEFTAPPGIGVGPGLYRLTEAAQRYLLAHAVVTLSLGSRVLYKLGEEEIETLLSAVYAFAHDEEPAGDKATAVRAALGDVLSKRDAASLAKLLPSPAALRSAKLPELLEAFSKSAVRMAAALTGDLAASVEAVSLVQPELREDLCGFLLSRRFREWCEK